MSDFSVKFRGVRGSYTVADKRFLEYGGNTSCVEVNVGNHKIILDAGTGIINLGESMIKEYLSSGTNVFDRKPMNVSVFLSHIHQDHIQGFPFFKPAHIKTTNLNVFGCSDDEEQGFEALGDSQLCVRPH